MVQRLTLASLFFVFFILNLIVPSFGQNWDSCSQAYYGGEITNGEYTVRDQTVYCENEDNGGGWLLLAKFSQHQSIGLLPQATYNDYFSNTSGIWIEGNSMGLPLTPIPSYDNYHVESHDWRTFLDVSKSYQFRQRLERQSGQVADVYFTFTYNGHVLQNDAPNDINNQSWVLTDRTVLFDNTSIVWDIQNETIRFWLPFLPGMTGNILTACDGYGYEPTGCDANTAINRRYGNAGIIGETTDSNDPASSWCPHTYGNPIYDIINVHQSVSLFGESSGQPMVSTYWFREIPFVTTNQITSEQITGEQITGEQITGEQTTGESVGTGSPDNSSSIIVQISELLIVMLLLFNLMI